jgi:hypothetical protein
MEWMVGNLTDDPLESKIGASQLVWVYFYSIFGIEASLAEIL